MAGNWARLNIIFHSVCSGLKTSSNWVFVFDMLNSKINILDIFAENLKVLPELDPAFLAFTKSSNQQLFTQQFMVDH